MFTNLLGQNGGKCLSFLVMPLPPPNFSQFKHDVISLIIFTVKPCDTDTEWTVEIVHFNLEKISELFSREQSKLSAMMSKALI